MIPKTQFIIFASNISKTVQLPFRTPMIIISFNIRLRLLETNIVKTGKRGPTYVLNGVIRHQKVLLPPHKNKIRIGQRLVVKIIWIEGLRILTKRSKFTLKILVKIHRYRSWKNLKHINLPNASCPRPRRRPIFSLKTDISD